jgi:GT2 family glycosyltransferase
MTVSYLSEGNMLVRRDVFKKIGVFDERLGMIGGKVAYGEGPDFQRRFIEKYPDEVIWYDAKLHVWHLIRDEKISILYRFKEALIRGASAIELRQQHSTLALVIAPFLFIYFVLKSLVSYLFKSIQSLFSKEHFFTLLHHDYENGTWRDIGSAWFRMKLLLQKLISFRRNK